MKLKTGLPVRIFGCVAYVHNPVHKNDKWSTKALKSVFLGYSATQKGYKVYHPLTRKHLVSKDVVFDEKMFYYQSTVMKELRKLPYLTTSDKTIIHQTETQEDNRSVSTPQFQQQEDTLSPANLETAPEEENPEEVTNNQGTVVPYPKYYERRRKRKLLESEVNQKSQESILENAGEVISDEGGAGWPIALRKGKRSAVKNLPYDMTHYLNFKNVSPYYRAFILQIQDISIPKTLQEAMGNIHWKGAMDEEITALLQNDTWDIVDLPEGKKTVSCRWVYTLKCKSDGSQDRYKARLVARGYTRTFGIDYIETFAPVAKINTIRILISLAVNFDWPLNQYDIKNTFLNGELK